MVLFIQISFKFYLHLQSRGTVKFIFSMSVDEKSAPISLESKNIDKRKRQLSDFSVV